MNLSTVEGGMLPNPKVVKVMNKAIKNFKQEFAQGLKSDFSIEVSYPVANVAEVRVDYHKFLGQHQGDLNEFASMKHDLLQLQDATGAHRAELTEEYYGGDVTDMIGRLARQGKMMDPSILLSHLVVRLVFAVNFKG